MNLLDYEPDDFKQVIADNEEVFELDPADAPVAEEEE